MRRLSLFLLLTACSSGDNTGPDPRAAVAGTWHAVAVNGQNLPATIRGSVIQSAELRLNESASGSRAEVCTSGCLSQGIGWGIEGATVELNYIDRIAWIPDTVRVESGGLIWNRADGFGTANGYDIYEMER